MRAVYWVLPGMLAGRPGPGEVSWNLAELWREGFRAIVCLTGVRQAAVQEAGFRYQCVFLNGGLAPIPVLRRRLARRMLPVVDSIGEELAAGRPTLVHCRQGRERTGAVLAGYLVRHGNYSPEEAIHIVRAANPAAMTSAGFDRLPALLGRQRERASL